MGVFLFVCILMAPVCYGLYRNARWQIEMEARRCAQERAMCLRYHVAYQSATGNPHLRLVK